MRQLFLAALAAACVGGCANSGSPTGGANAMAEDFPVYYREMIIAKAKESFVDPYSIRDASISTPIPGNSVMGQVLTVCVRANAKNRMGGYTGLKATSFVFRGGQITAIDNEYADISCASAIYSPFPEIEAGYVPPKSGPPQKGKKA